MDGLPGVADGRLRITVLADVSDPAWRGDVAPHQLEDRAYFFTDLFLGVVRFTVVDGPRSLLVETASARTAVFGCLDMLATGLAVEGEKIVPDYVGNRLVLRVGGRRAHLSDGVTEIEADRTIFAQRLMDAFDASMALVGAAYGPGPPPRHLDEVRRHIAASAALLGDV